MMAGEGKVSLHLVLILSCTLSNVLGVGRGAGLQISEYAQYIGTENLEVRYRRSDGISSVSGGVFEPASSGFARLPYRHAVDRKLRRASLIQARSKDGSSSPDDAGDSVDGLRKPTTTVWVAGWPRSGSTTMFEMVLAGALQQPKMQQPSGSPDENSFLRVPSTLIAGSRSHFGLFEPCHWGLGNTTPPDRYSAELEGDCGRVMDRLVNCNFSGVEFLFGWSTFSGPHTDISGVNSKTEPYDPTLANRVCSSSDLVVYKTVQDYGRSVSNLLPILDSHPNLQVIVPVRDPRGIAASWKRRPWGANGVALLLDICKQHKANLYQQHPRLRRVVFERLASDPVRVMSSVFEFLNLEFGASQMEWINQTFDSSCEGRDTGDFSVCHTDSKEPVTRWRTQLTAEELQAFDKDPDCREVAQEYGYPLEEVQEELSTDAKQDSTADVKGAPAGEPGEDDDDPDGP